MTRSPRENCSYWWPHGKVEVALRRAATQGAAFDNDFAKRYLELSPHQAADKTAENLKVFRSLEGLQFPVNGSKMANIALAATDLCLLQLRDLVVLASCQTTKKRPILQFPEILRVSRGAQRRVLGALLYIFNTAFSARILAVLGLPSQARTLIRSLDEAVHIFSEATLSYEGYQHLINAPEEADAALVFWRKNLKPGHVRKRLEEVLIQRVCDEALAKALMLHRCERYKFLSIFAHANAQALELDIATAILENRRLDDSLMEKSLAHLLEGLWFFWRIIEKSVFDTHRWFHASKEESAWFFTQSKLIDEVTLEVLLTTIYPEIREDIKVLGWKRGVEKHLRCQSDKDV